MSCFFLFSLQVEQLTEEQKNGRCIFSLTLQLKDELPSRQPSLPLQLHPRKGFGQSVPSLGSSGVYAPGRLCLG